MRKLVDERYTQPQLAAALLWYDLTVHGKSEHRIADLCRELSDLGLSRPNPTRLFDQLFAQGWAVRGSTPRGIKLDLRRRSELDERLAPLLAKKPKPIGPGILPIEWADGQTGALRFLFAQINGCYELGYYDAAAVLMRRLLESLIIKAFLVANREVEVKRGKVFLPLEDLIVLAASIVHNRNARRTMDAVKKTGDLAAHHISYQTMAVDIERTAADLRPLVHELIQFIEERSRS